MLLPRFNLRTLLAICTMCAVVFVMVGTAYRGQYWAWGVTIAVISLVVTALVHCVWFGLASSLAAVMSSRQVEPAPVDVANFAARDDGRSVAPCDFAAVTESPPTTI